MPFLKASISPLAAFALFAALVATVVPAGASILCGDDVDGRRVACSCGDTMVSDTRLQRGDPVVSTRCPYNGLEVRARAGASSIQLDMSGLAIVGRGSGTGILVIDGGEQGAVILGGDPSQQGSVSGFRSGVRARGTRGLREIRNVTASANAGDGMVLRSHGTTASGVAAEANARDGLRIGARGAKVEGATAVGNGRYGVRVGGRGAQVEAGTADNAADGSHIVGRDHALGIADAVEVGK